MARIVGIDLPNSKRVEIGLTYIHGIGRTVSSKILKTTGVNPDTRVSDLTEEEISKIAAVIRSDYRVEGDLRREVTTGIRRLMDIGSYRGIRHKRSLPVRGQRTKTNARMRKGPRKLVGARKQRMVPKGQKK